VQDEEDWIELMAFDIIVFLSELAFTDSLRITACKWEFYMQINLPTLCTFIDRYSPSYFFLAVVSEMRSGYCRVY
jgi:hypothetical protein